MSTTRTLTKRLFNQRPFRNTLLVLIPLSIFLGLIVVIVESVSSKANILTPGDGLWWAITTVTGVGYGDVVPVTPWGRLIGALLESLGVIMFGLIIGMIGITMGRKQEEHLWFRLFERIDKLEHNIALLEKKSNFLIHNDKKETSATQE